MSTMASVASAPNSMGIGPRQRRNKRRTPAPSSQAGQGPWMDSSWVQSFSSQGPSPLGNPQDLTPAFALRKIVLLLEKEKFIDVSQLINQLNNVILKSILHELPVAPFIENIPDSLVALESLYSKLFVLDPENFPVERLNVEGAVFHVVRYLSLQQSMLDGGLTTADEDSKNSITNILRIVLFVKPDIVSLVHARRKMMENALMGIGEHSLVKVAGSLMNLHDGLKIEFDKTVCSYKTAVQQLEQLSLSNPKPVTLKSFANRSLPSANHQILMTYTEAEIQERLFKNKTVLNAVESNMTTQLPYLIQTLKERIENDKNALLAFGRLRREIKGIAGDARVAPVLTQYSKSLNMVLGIFKLLLDEQFPERKTNGLNFPEQDDQVLKLEEVDSASAEAATAEAARVNSPEGLYSGISDAKIPPPPSHPPPSIPSAQSPAQFEHEKNDVANGPPTSPEGQPQQQQSRGRVRTRRKKGTKSRATSLDRSHLIISRPERESVEDNSDFQMMMKRINSVSASSPVEKNQVNGSRRSSQSSSSDGHQKPPLPPRNSIRNPSAGMGGGGGHHGGYHEVQKGVDHGVPQGEEAAFHLRQEASKREAVEKQRDRLHQLYAEAQRKLEKNAEELRAANSAIARLQENERRMNDELKKQSSNPGHMNNKTSSLPRPKRTIIGDLLYEYDKLYSHKRAEAWMALKNMSEQRQFEDNDDLKDKVLFSVIVLAFRTARSGLEAIQGGVCRLLKSPHSQGNAQDGRQGQDQREHARLNTRTSDELLEFLRRLGDDGYDLHPMTEEVENQLFVALYDYPKLKSSSELHQFIRNCMSLAWRLTIQEVPLTITYNSTTFDPEIHQRAPATNRRSPTIKAYIWPCLVEEDTGQCVYKGVVVT